MRRVWGFDIDSSSIGRFYSFGLRDRFFCYREIIGYVDAEVVTV